MYCKNCTRKHLGQAMVLLHEARFGHPSHLWLVVGHLAEAEREICDLSVSLANKIRETRHLIEDDTDAPVDILNLIEEVSNAKI